MQFYVQNQMIKIPTNSTLTKKFKLLWKITNKFNENINFNYDFSINSDLNELQYNSFGTTIIKNNFVTTFTYIEENGPIGNNNILENVTTFNFDEQNFITLKQEKIER